MKLITPHGNRDNNLVPEISLPRAFAEKISPIAQPALEQLLCWAKLNDLYSRVHSPDDPSKIWPRILESLNVSYRVSADELARIPKSGPVVVVANHPYGGIEGVMLAALLCSARRDVKLLANQVLWSFPGLRDSLIPVDPFGERTSKLFNIRGLKAAIHWLREGGVLAVFPAGEVAHVNVQQFAITDPPWHDAVSALIRKTSAAALPVYFDGSNGPLFQLLGMVHPLLRTVMLPSELLNKQCQDFLIRVGRLIGNERLRAFAKDDEATQYLRGRTYLLGYREKPQAGWKPSWNFRRARRAGCSGVAFGSKPDGKGNSEPAGRSNPGGYPRGKSCCRAR
jgi:putative hemolysin